MTRLCWVFVLLVVVLVAASSDDARIHQCVQKGRSLANLELVEDALKKAKQLFPNCGEENENSNCSECNQKDKSLGFIDVALDLVSNEKKSIQICPPVATDEPTPEITGEGIRPMDCQELLAAGHVTSGVYSVWPRGGKSAIRVRCDMDTDGGGWTVIQRRGNFSQQENFDRDWQDYKNGFGDLERDFWLGNDHIFDLSNQGSYSLRMDMTAADGESAYALYREFRIGDENANYKLRVDNYEGTAGDGMTYSSSEMFSTRDREKDQWPAGNCAEGMKGGFWYDSCALCNPNGLYKPGMHDQTSMYYFKFKEYVGLFSFEMKLKRLESSSAIETNLQD